MSEPAVSSVIRARRSGFLHDLLSIAGRAIRAVPREPEVLFPALSIPVFFFVVNVGALRPLAERALEGFDYRAFQLPVAIIFAVTGVSRASALVSDIRGGYFDRLMVTPVSRFSLLLGLMAADLTLVIALTLPVVALGLIVGVRFESGVLGAVLFVVLGGLWGLAFTGFPYAIALKTGNPSAVNSSFLLFFPLAFLTTTFLPKEALSGWLSTVVDFNPVTYVLESLRSLLLSGWDRGALLRGLAAIAGVGLVSVSLALAALRGRLSPD